jgi:hypothetical protein
MTPKKIVDSEFERLEIFLLDFNYSMQEVQSSIFDELLKLVQKLPQTDGVLKNGDKVADLINKFEKKILDELEKGRYSKEYGALVKNLEGLDTIKKEAAAYLNEADRIKIFKFNTDPIRKGYINMLSTTLGSKETFGINVISPLKNILYEHSALGLTTVAATKKLFDVALSSDPTGGILGRYAGQVAHDALFGFTGAIDQGIGDYIGAKNVNYLGDIIRDSRPQCVRWVSKFGGYIPEEKLPSEITWAKKNGKGYSKHLPELSVDTFAIVRGGHNCRHRVVYTKKKTNKVAELEKRYKEKGEQYEKLEADKLTGRAKILYDKNKTKVDELVERYGK